MQRQPCLAGQLVMKKCPVCCFALYYLSVPYQLHVKTALDLAVCQQAAGVSYQTGAPWMIGCHLVHLFQSKREGDSASRHGFGQSGSTDVTLLHTYVEHACQSGRQKAQRGGSKRTDWSSLPSLHRFLRGFWSWWFAGEKKIPEMQRVRTTNYSSGKLVRSNLQPRWFW